MSLVNQPLCEKLKAAREERGLSLADVEHKTRIPISRLVQLEEGNYAAFGSTAYARSFLRTYSKYLEVEADDVINGLPTPVLGGPDDYRHLTESYGPWVAKRGMVDSRAGSASAKLRSPLVATLALTLFIFAGIAVFAAFYVVPGLMRKPVGDAARSASTLPAVSSKPLGPAAHPQPEGEIKRAEPAHTIIVDAAHPAVPYRRATLVEEPRNGSVQSTPR